MTFTKRIDTLDASLATAFGESGEFDPIFPTADSETVTVGLGESVLSLFAPFAFFADGFSFVTLNNSGNITSVNGDGIVGDGGAFSLINTSTGYIAAQNYGVVLVGPEANASNAGTIIAGMVGIAALFGDSTVTNTGTIISDDIGIVLDNFGAGPAFAGLVVPTTGTTVTNDGVIIAGSDGIVIESFGFDTVINNSGDIVASNNGIKAGGNYTTINNTGSITGDVGIHLQGVTTVTNGEDGFIGPSDLFVPVIDGELPLAPFPGGILGDAIYADGFGTLNLTNDGEIYGNINLGDGTGNDVIVNNGVITGDVLLGAGDDMFTAGAGSKVMGNPIFEETFTSEAYGPSGEIFGGSGNDTIYGHSQNEVIYGDADEDYLKGRGGNDHLFGGSENDTLVAGGGNDTLVGGSGDDRLIGNQGNNIMIGGEGADRMRAGSGTDTFVWTSETESGIDAATSDVILMFEVGVDKLDFQSTVAGQLYFSAIGDVGVVGEGYVFVTDNGTDSFVSVDVEGDGVIDMVVELKDTLGLTVDDFLGASEDIFLA